MEFVSKYQDEMKIHKITLNQLEDSEVKLDYLIPLLEEETFDVMEILTDLHEIIHGGKWNAMCVA